MSSRNAKGNLVVEVKVSKETEPVWNGEYLESLLRGKLDKLVSLWDEEFCEKKGLEGGICNLDRIRKVRESLQVSSFLNDFKTELDAAVTNCGRCAKSVTMSNTLREEGNEFYKQKNLPMALKGFTLSLCFAPSGSKELALAYSNRSACFIELNQFQDSLKDIDNSLRVLETNHKQNKELEVVKRKLGERKARCEGKLSEGNNNNYDKEQIVGSSHPDFFKLKSCNKFINAAEDFVTISNDYGRGRNVKVTQDVKPGTVIILEEPYSKVLVKHLRWEIGFCHNCFKEITCRPCLPCPECVYAVYCNESCLKSDERIHKYDCKMFQYLHKLELKRLVILSYRTLTKLGPENLYKFWKTKSQQEANNPSQDKRILGFSPDGKYDSSSYYSINCLIYHIESLTELELRQYSIESVLITDLLDESTDFFRSTSCANNQEVDSLKEFASSLILLHQMNFPCNAHSLNLLKLSCPTPSVEEIRLATTVDFGAGAFALLSMINHSCDPNVTRVTLPNGINAVVTIRGLKAGDEVLDNYGAHYAIEDYTSRQEHLKSNYNFQCDCIPCKCNWPTMDKLQESEEIFMCSICSQTVQMNEYFKKSFKECILDNGKCHRCGKIVVLEELINHLKDKINNFNSAYESVLENRPFETMKTLTECLNYFESHVLPPYIYTNFAQETLKHAFNLIAINHNRNKNK